MPKMTRLIFTTATALLLSLTASVSQQVPDQSVTPKLGSSDIAILQSSAEKGDVAAERKLAQAYDEGNGISQNDALAAMWYRKAADQGDADAQNGLGVMCRYGRGVEKNKDEAVRWYHKAAKQGNATAMFNLGAAYYNGDEGVHTSLDMAYVWFLLSQEAGNAQAKEAVARTAKELPSTADALVDIGAMYEKGEDLPKNPAQAERWYGEAAKLSDSAKVLLATMLINGRGVPKDYPRALELCKAAADHRNESAQFCVGYLYQNGFGVQKNPTEAVKWYQLAATNGILREIHSQATHALAEMYAKGDGVPADRVEAYYWFFLAWR